jgi:hypothetical protein
MFISIKDQPTDFQDEQAPRSSPPWVWVGFLFVIAFLTLEVALAFTPLDEGSVSLGLQLIALAGWIYWLVCIYRIHKILNQLSHRYPYSPGEAVGKHFIPFYNLYWIFEWPSELSRYINNRGRVRMIPGGVIGTMILSGMLLRLFDGAIGLAILFGVTMYISITLKRHVAAVKGISPDQLPPLPDPKIFSRPIESSTVMTQEIVGGSEPVKPA